MKIDLKLVFLSLVVFGLVCETAGWWRGGSRRSSGSRSTPSSSRRSWGWGSRRRSSPSPPPSSSRRRSWGWRSRRRSSPSPPPSSSRRRSWGWRSRRRSSPSPSSSRRRFWGWGSRRRGTSSSTSSSLTKGKIAYPHDIKTKSGLRKLFNSRVTSIKHVERPMSGMMFNTGIPNHDWKHTGVVVTTANGKKYLIHKGKGYGKSSQPVVVDAKHMSSKWRVTAGRGTKPVNGYKIKDFVSKGGKGYFFIGNNCQRASGRMYKQGDDKLGKRNSCSG